MIWAYSQQSAEYSADLLSGRSVKYSRITWPDRLQSTEYSSVFYLRRRRSTIHVWCSMIWADSYSIQNSVVCTHIMKLECERTIFFRSFYILRKYFNEFIVRRVNVVSVEWRKKELVLRRIWPSQRKLPLPLKMSYYQTLRSQSVKTTFHFLCRISWCSWILTRLFQTRNNATRCNKLEIYYSTCCISS